MLNFTVANWTRGSENAYLNVTLSKTFPLSAIKELQPFVGRESLSGSHLVTHYSSMTAVILTRRGLPEVQSGQEAENPALHSVTFSEGPGRSTVWVIVISALWYGLVLPTGTINILECNPVRHPGWPPRSCGWGIQRWFCRSGLRVSRAAISTVCNTSGDRQDTVTNFCERGGDQYFLHHWDWPAFTPSWVLCRRGHKASQQKIQNVNPGFSDATAMMLPWCSVGEETEVPGLHILSSLLAALPICCPTAFELFQIQLALGIGYGNGIATITTAYMYRGSLCSGTVLRIWQESLPLDPCSSISMRKMLFL